MKFKWFFSLINICAILLIAASLFVLLTVVMTPSGQVPQVMGFSLLRVLTGSMEPTIPEDSILLIQRTDPSELQPGDIISFFSPDPALDGALNTHRIQRIDSDGKTLQFITKGDANLIEDQQPVEAQWIAGKVIYISPTLGKVVRLVSNPLVFGLAILLPLAGMLIANLIRALRSALLLAKEEEAEAVRQALDAIKNRSNNQEDGK